MTEGIVKASVIGAVAVPDSPSGIDMLAEKFADVMHMEDVENVIKAFDEQEELLKKAAEFGSLRARYASLEAATYCKLARKGWSKALGTSLKMRRRAAEWLAAQEQTVYEQIIEGILSAKYSDLTDAFKNITNDRAVRSTYKHAISFKHEIIDEFKRDGRVLLWSDDYRDDTEDPTGETAEVVNETECFVGEYVNHLGSSPARLRLDKTLHEIAAMARDSTRIALRKAGAVGIGNGVYIDPTKYPEELAKAIGIRKDNVAACVMSLMSFCNEAGFDFKHELEEALSMVGWSKEKIIESIDHAAGGVAA